LAGCEVTAMQVSRAAAAVDAELAARRATRLPACRYVFLDARYEKVRHGGRLLGVSVALSEAVTWNEFLEREAAAPRYLPSSTAVARHSVQSGG